jgi:secreted Zn-dependent insulinase-like peptidase
MKKFAISAVALLATPAFAQIPAAGPTAPASAPAAATAAQAAPAEAAAPTKPADILKVEFPTYDKDATGNLDKSELSAWLTALMERSPPKTPLTAAQKTAWLDKSFKDADADKSGNVNLAELTKHLIPAG